MGGGGWGEGVLVQPAVFSSVIFYIFFLPEIRGKGEEGEGGSLPKSTA